eukprot:SAG22_NODE_19705_length_272_cov_0.884393_1_plen_52_part_10
MRREQPTAAVMEVKVVAKPELEPSEASSGAPGTSTAAAAAATGPGLLVPAVT